MKQKKFRQYRSNQGRSPEQMEKVYKGCFYMIVVFLCGVAFTGLYNLVSL